MMDLLKYHIFKKVPMYFYNNLGLIKVPFFKRYQILKQLHGFIRVTRFFINSYSLKIEYEFIKSTKFV